MCIFSNFESELFIDGNKKFRTLGFENLSTNYVLSSNGRLIKQSLSYDDIPYEERPYFNKPEWNENILHRVEGSISTKVITSVDMNFHGVFDVIVDSMERDDVKYELKFTNGDLEEIRKVYGAVAYVVIALG